MLAGLGRELPREIELWGRAIGVPVRTVVVGTDAAFRCGASRICPSVLRLKIRCAGAIPVRKEGVDRALLGLLSAEVGDAEPPGGRYLLSKDENVNYFGSTSLVFEDNRVRKGGVTFDMMMVVLSTGGS